MTLAEIEKTLFETNPSYLSNLGGVGLGKLAPFIESAVLAMQKRDWVSVGLRGQSIACLRGASTANISNGSSSYKIAPSIGTPGCTSVAKRWIGCIFWSTCVVPRWKCGFGRWTTV